MFPWMPLTQPALYLRHASIVATTIRTLLTICSTAAARALRTSWTKLSMCSRANDLNSESASLNRVSLSVRSPPSSKSFAQSLPFALRRSSGAFIRFAKS